MKVNAHRMTARFVAVLACIVLLQSFPALPSGGAPRGGETQEESAVVRTREHRAPVQATVAGRTQMEQKTRGSEGPLWGLPAQSCALPVSREYLYDAIDRTIAPPRAPYQFRTGRSPPLPSHS